MSSRPADRPAATAQGPTAQSPTAQPEAAAPGPPVSALAPGEVPDLPAGISGSDPESPLQYTPADVAAATELLDRAGEGEPQLVVALTDEQIAALDGYARRQFIASPWLDEHSEQRRFAAGVALRALIAAEQVRLHPDEGSGTRQWRAVPEIAACLVLRRTAELFTTAERTVQTGQGPQVHRLHYYAHSTGVLEEEVTSTGFHRFTALAPAQASGRLADFVNPLGTAGVESETLRVRTSELATHPIAQRLAETQALSVLTMVRTEDGGVQQLHAYATAGGVLTMEALDPGTADPQLEFRSVDGAELHALASVLVGNAG